MFNADQLASLEDQRMSFYSPTGSSPSPPPPSTTDRQAGLTSRLRQTINTVARRGQDPSTPRHSTADLRTLSTQSQELILRTVEAIKKEDSENVIDTLDESRDILRHSLEEFKREQDEYRQQLAQIMRNKEAAMQRPKENAIPLSILLRQKNDVTGLADLRPNTSINPTYQAYFEALLVNDNNEQQHPTDKAAVVKYIRRRERRKRAEENKSAHQLTEDVIEKQTAELLQHVEGVDIKLEHERQRQAEVLRLRMEEKRMKNNNLLQANEILDQANEAELLRQRAEQAQREKIEARLSAARHQQQRSRSPTNLIHVQSRGVDESEEGGSRLDEEQKRTTQQSLALLDDGGRNRSVSPSRGAMVYGDRDDRVGDIEI